MSNKTQKPQKLKRNERERNRVHLVNQGFNTLRERVPRPAGTKHKLSKVETLREAARYIEHLRAVLGDNAAALLSLPAGTPSPSYYQPQQGYYQPPTGDSCYQPDHQTSPCNSFYSDSSYEELKFYVR